MDVWVVSSLRLFQMKLLRAFMFKSLYGHMPSFLMGKNLRVEWLGCMVGLYLLFSALPNCFLK